MSWQVVIMFAVAAILAVAGIVMLVSLTRPSGPAKIYVFRMAGIMALAAGAVLAFSAWSMARWEAPSPPSTPAPG